MDCQDIRDDIDLCALGTLEPAEEDRVRAHVASCAVCHAALGEAEDVVTALARTAPRRRAPASLRAAVLAAIRAEQPVPAAPVALRTRRIGRWPMRYGMVAAALVIVPLGGLLIWAAMLQYQVNNLRHDTDQMQRRNDGLLLLAMPSSIKADFQPVGDARGATGAVTWNPSRNVCFVLFDRLPPPEPGAAYRLWYIVDGGRRVIDAGTITPGEDGKVDLILDASNWRGQEYEMVLRLEHRPQDPTAPALLTARLRRSE